MSASGFTFYSAAEPQLVDAVNRMFGNYQQNYKAVLRDQPFIIKEAKPMYSGTSTIFAERIITSQYANLVPEGEPADTYPAQTGYEKAAYIEYYKKTISITRTMRVAGKENEIQDNIRSLIEGPSDRLELDLAHRFSNAWSPSYTNKDGVPVDTTTGDGLALVSGSHTLTGVSTTWSNQVSSNAAFSKSAMELGLQIAKRNTYNNLGENVDFNATHIVTTDDPVTCNQVKELLNATANVTSDNAGTYNVYKNAVQHVVVPRIATTATGSRDTTKEKYWFLVDSNLSSFYLTVLEQPYIRTPSNVSNAVDFLTENLNFLSGASYGIAVVSARGIVGSKGDASA
jgi:hypothetical protein